MKLYLQLRGKTYYYNRRVPKKLTLVEGRSDIKISLNTGDYDRAKAKAANINAQIEKRWSAMQVSDSARAEKCWKAIQDIASSYDFSYVDAHQLIKSKDLKAIGDRLDVLEKAGKSTHKPTVQAVLGTAQKPEIKLSDALDKYFSLNRDMEKRKSENQLRKWKNPRIKAVRNFTKLVGQDMPINQITPEMALDFRDWWMDRVLNEGLQSDTANKDIGNLNAIVTKVGNALRIKTESPFKGMRLKPGKGERTPPFSNEFVQSKILAEGAFDKLDEDQRLVLYMLIETGARPGEIINLAPENILIKHEVPHIRIRARENREVKTGNAERDIPLVGISLWAAKQRPKGFPSLADREDSVSANINKYFRNHGLKESPKHRVYSLRSSFQDRMIAVRHPDLGAMPERMQADLFGHRTDRPKYGSGCTSQNMEIFKQAKAYFELMAYGLPAWAR